MGDDQFAKELREWRNKAIRNSDKYYIRELHNLTNKNPNKGPKKKRGKKAVVLLTAILTTILILLLSLLINQIHTPERAIHPTLSPIANTTPFLVESQPVPKPTPLKEPVTNIIRETVRFVPSADCTVVRNVDAKTYVMRCDEK